MRHRGDIYFSRDFPVLDAIAAWEEQGRVGRALDSVEVAALVGRPHGDVVQSIGRLFHAASWIASTPAPSAARTTS